MQSADNISPTSPLSIVRLALAHRRLILRLARREVEARYRGSVLGIAWSVLTPLLMVAAYTFVFSVIFQPRWNVPPGANANFALLLYSGLLVFAVFSECAARAPGLVLENVSYIKKVVFPLEIMPLVAMVAAGVNFVIGFGVLMVLYVAMLGLPPATILLLPLVMVPVVLFTLGFTWLLAALGVFLRDLRHAVGILVSLMMFLGPIFYPVTAVPEGLRWLLYLNPLTLVLEFSKDVLFWGTVPSLALLAGTILAAWATAWLGHLCFAKLRPGFADVV
jgi:lipopolysaccharide transport system permease protein